MTEKVGLYHYPGKQRPWMVRWFGEYNPETGRRRRYGKAFRLKRDAEQFQAAKQAELNKGAKRDKPEDFTLEAFCNRFIETYLCNCSHSHRQCCKNTIRQLKKYLGPNTLFRLVDRQQAEAFISSRVRIDRNGEGKRISGWTRAQHLKHCRAMWRRAVKWGVVAENVFDGFKAGDKPTRPWHHITPPQLQQLLANASDARWRAVFWVLYGCGLRFGEAYNLIWADIDFEKGFVHVRNRAPTKDIPPFTVKSDGRGGASKERSIPMPKPVVDALTEWQSQAPEGVPFVLMTKERFEIVGRNWHRCQKGLPREGAKKPRPWQNRDMANNVLRTVKRWAKKAAIPLTAPVTVHTFRKSFGQNHADNGTPIHVLQHLMGHSSIATTREFYIRVGDANTQAATSRYERLLAGVAGDDEESVLTTDIKLTSGPAKE